jgi:hypothetical protein
MIRLFSVILVLSILVGCGGSSSSTSTSAATPTPTPTATPTPTPAPTPTPTPAPQNLVLTPGNWDFTLTNAGNSVFLAGGNISQTGNIISGALHFAGLCTSNATDFPSTGTTTPNGATINLPAEGTQGALTMHLTGTASSMNGSYTAAQGCILADSGTVVATFVSSLTATTWSGSFLTSAGPPLQNFAAAASFTQTAADIHGVAGLTGTATTIGSPCFTSMAVQLASVIGQQVSITFLNSNNGGQTFFTGKIAPVGTAKNISGTYNTVGGPCAGDQGSATFSRP